MLVGDLRNLAVIAILSIAMIGHSGEVRPIAFQKKSIELIAQLGYEFEAPDLALTPNGKVALTTVRAGGEIRVYDSRSGLQLRSLRPSPYVSSLEPLPDNQTAIVLAETGPMRVDLSTGKVLKNYEVPPELYATQAPTLVVSEDGRYFGVTASADSKQIIQVFKVGEGDGKPIFQKTLDTPIKVIALSRQSGRLAYFNLDGTHVIDLATGKEVDKLESPMAVFDARFSPKDDSLAIVSHDAVLQWFLGTDGRGYYNEKAWRDGFKLSSGETFKDFSVAGIGFDSKGIAFAEFNDISNRIRIFANGPVEEKKVPEGLFYSKFLDESHFVAQKLSDQTVGVYDALAGRFDIELKGYTTPINTFASSPDDRWALTGTTRDQLNLWDLSTGQMVKRLMGHDGPIVGIAFNKKGDLAVTASGNGVIQVWDTANWKSVSKFTPIGLDNEYSNRVESLAISPNGSEIAISSNQRGIVICDLKTGAILRELQPKLYPLFGDVDYSPDGKRLLLGGAMKGPAMIDATTGEIEAQLQISDESSVTTSNRSNAFSPDGKTYVTGFAAGTAWIIDSKTHEPIRPLKGHTKAISAIAFSPDGKLIATGCFDTHARIYRAETGELLQTIKGFKQRIWWCQFTADSKRLLLASEDTQSGIWDVESGRMLCRLLVFAGSDWAVVDEVGRYDASNAGQVQGLHWSTGEEAIQLNQLKSRFFEPGLLGKHLGKIKEPLRDVESLKDIALFPSVEATLSGKKLSITLENRGGGIGPVKILVNGKEVQADARDSKINPAAPKAKLELDISGYAPLLAPGDNNIEILAANAEGFLISRATRVTVKREVSSGPPPEFYAVIVGTSDYTGESLDLKFASKDATDFAAAIQLGAERLFTKERVHIVALTGNAASASKPAIIAALNGLKSVKPTDVVLLYFAGHGVALPGDTYAYLTSAASTESVDSIKTDLGLRAKVAVTSEEIADSLRSIPAQKQVVILDTCAAGAAAVKLTDRREVSTDQVRAIERLKDRTGVHILMGCSSDAVSYEASRFGQGLLTYSLLQGMSGVALREGEFVDVAGLFRYAEDAVSNLAAGLGGVQRPRIAAPSGQSFDIGQMQVADRAKIQLAKALPLVLRPNLVDADQGFDSKGITPTLTKLLREEGALVTRGKASLVFIEGDEMAGAIRPSGIYTIQGDKISIRLVLVRDGEPIKRLNVEGAVGDMQKLVADLVDQIKMATVGL